MMTSWKRQLQRLWPDALFARLTLIWIMAIMAGHIINNIWLSWVENESVQIQAGYYLKTDMVNLHRLLERTAPEERAAWLPFFQRPNYQFRLLEKKPLNAPFNASADQRASRAIGHLQQAMGDQYALQATSGLQAPYEVAFTLTLNDGTRLEVQAQYYRAPQSMLGGIIILVQIVSLGIFTWAAVKQATRPLQNLANSADKLGASLECEPLVEEGPIEVRRAAAAFNAMQQRIVDHLSERMQILAAISHDLQTPITRMRLRADLLDSDEQRNKLTQDLDTMQSLVEEGIAYARSAQSAGEALSKIDLDAMLESLVFDYDDAQHQLTLNGHYGQPLITRPNALKRLLCNLIDNALKYAEDVTIEVRQDASQLHIAVLDRGPGIPEYELEKVLQPFYRLEASRNRNTGGTGLGLAIAYQLSLALQAELKLLNRVDGGLEARLSLRLSN